MPDDKMKPGKADRIRINIGEKFELDRWKKTLAVTGQQLSAAVRKAGPMLANVKAYLRTRAKQIRPKT